MFAREFTKQIDYFAYPRVGSHLLFHCLSGLYELVMFDMDCLANEEVRSRLQEVNPSALYALRLRDSNAASPPPIHVDPAPNGIHGEVVDRGLPILCLVREPIATVYSAYRLRKDRLSEKISDPGKWVCSRLKEYEGFYRRVMEVKADVDDRFLLLRFEELVTDVAPLEALCKFVGAQPKLDPSFVRYVTDFEFFVLQGERTFYRSGKNDSWKRDEHFASLIASITYPDVPGLGYEAPTLVA